MSKRPLLKMCVLVLSALILFAPFASAQQPEWMMKIPKYHRMTGGSSQFVVDHTRNAMLFDGGAYDTYATYDGGATWELIFDMKMFFIDGSTKWFIDRLGNWYYEGKVYDHPYIHLASEDAGKTIRYLITDTAQVPYARQYERMLMFIPPHSVVFDYSIFGPDDNKHGIYSSCDAGRNWLFTKMPSNWRSQGDFSPVSSNSISLSLANGKHLEYNLCDATSDSTSIAQSDAFLRLGDSITIIYSVTNANIPLRVLVRGNQDTVKYPQYTDPENGVRRSFVVRSVATVNDTMAVIVGQMGVVATYGLKAGLRFIDIPPIRNAHQQVCDAGLLGDRLLIRSLSPTASADSVARWTLFNTRTGECMTHVRPSAVHAQGLFLYSLTMFEGQRVVAYSDSMWLASPALGEVMSTTDAGQTWTMVDNMPRDERWGLTFIGASRLYPRGDGSMAVLTSDGRLMSKNPESSKWGITHLGPFAHTIKLPKDYYASFSSTNVIYQEDFFERYRLLHGPSTVYFQTPDTLWASGDVVTSWTTEGKYLDTILPRRARTIKRVSPELIVAAMDSTWFSWTEGKEWVYISNGWPKAIEGKDTARASLGDIVVAKSGELIAGLRGIRLMDTLGVAIDSIPGGIIRSNDKGATWSPGSIGIPNNLYVCSLLRLPSGTLLALAAEVTMEPTIVNQYGSSRRPLNQCGRKQCKLDQVYIYRSVDHGHTWTKVHIFPSREYLPLVDPRLTLMPDGRVMAIHPDVGIAISPNDGVWFSVGDPLYIGNPVVNDVVFTDDGWAHFATDSGYVRVRIDNILDVQAESSVVGSLTAYVNASRMLHIADPTMVPTSVRLVCIDGRTVRHASNNAGVTELDVSALATGTYVVVASTGDIVRTALVQLY